MAIGGFLGGLANLGAVAGGTQDWQTRQIQQQRLLAELANQQQQQQIQALQLQQLQKQQARAGQEFGLLKQLDMAGLYGGGPPNLPGGAAFGQPNYSPGQIQAQPLPPATPQRPVQFASNVSPQAFEDAVLKVESGNRDFPPDSRTGAVGPGQIMPSTAAGYGVGGAALRDPATNRNLSRRISGDLYSQFGGNIDAAAAGYNAGPKRGAAIAGGAPLSSLPGETQKYIARIHQELSLPPAQQQVAQQGAIQVAGSIPPPMIGRLDPTSLARQIDRVAGPGVDDETKMGMLADLYPLLSQGGQQQFQQAFEQYKFAVGEQDKAAVRAETASRDRATEEYRNARLAQMGGSGGKAAQFGTVNDLMQRWRDDYKQSHGGQEPPTDAIAEQRAKLTQESRPAGRQLAQVTQRLEIGANEVARAVQAMTALPYGTTLGLFGGAQAQMGPELVGNVKRALANAVTPESSQVLQALTRGVSRGLAVLESGGSAQGLVGLSKQLESDLPLPNDTGLTIAAKFADIRQITEAAVDVLKTNPDMQNQPKQLQLLEEIEKNVQKAIPFSTTDVAKMTGDPSDEDVKGFAQRMGLGQSTAWVKQGDHLVGPDGQTQPLPPAFRADPDGSKYEK